MATKYQIVTKNGMTRQTYQNMSWTVLFFNAFVPLFRRDMWGFLILFILGILSGGFSCLVMCFLYNKMHREMLASDGWAAVQPSESK